MLRAASLSSPRRYPPRLLHPRAAACRDGIYASLNGGVGSQDNPAACGREPRPHGGRARRRRRPAAHRLPDPLARGGDGVDAPWAPDARPRADAIVTRVPGSRSASSTADCGPMLFADAQARVVGAAHAGWRGAFTGVIEATIAAMERAGADRARIVAALGPMIRQPNYEVGPEFVDRFRDRRRSQRSAFSSRPGGRRMPCSILPGYIAARLAAAGVRCEDIGRCTYAEADTFFSFRRSVHRARADYGRHVNAIALVD